SASSEGHALAQALLFRSFEHAARGCRILGRHADRLEKRDLIFSLPPGRHAVEDLAYFDDSANPRLDEIARLHQGRLPGVDAHPRAGHGRLADFSHLWSI